MFVKVVASPSGNKFQHRIQQNLKDSPTKNIQKPKRSSSGSFGGTPSTVVSHPKKRSVVSSSSQLKFTALAQMAEARNRTSVLSQSTETSKSDPGPIENLIPPPTNVRKSESIQSIRRVGRRVRDNHCCVALFFFFFGLLFNGVSYLISVQTAQLNSQVVDAAVANHENNRFNFKKAFIEGPSKYIIGLLSFLGRMTSAIGTFFLAQAVVTWLQKRRSTTLRSAAGHADEAIGEVHGGCAEIVADCWTNCIPAFG